VGSVTAVAGIVRDITEQKKMNEKLSVVGRLTRHDVGNKLIIAKSNMYLLKKQIGDNPKLSGYIEGIDSALDQSDKMFEFSRFYEKIGVEEPSEVDVFQYFNQAVALFPNLDDVRVVNECHGLDVVADSLLEQLFYNFIDNSLKHGEKSNSDSTAFH
jgi:signal transduction histidine kinase